MYVTAQRVENEHGEEAVHLFAYVHGDHAVPGLDWTAPDAGFVAEVYPGQLLLSSRPISGQRLAVRSFLDVALADALAPHGAWLLRRLVAKWPGAKTWPMSWTAEDVGGRFYVVASRRDDVESHLNELHEALLPVLGAVVPRALDHLPRSLPASHPIVVLRRRSKQGFEFSLDSNYRTALEFLGVTPLHAVVSTSRDNYDAFERVTGQNLERHVVLTLTQLSIEQLDALGGVAVLDEAGKNVWLSPALAGRSKSA